MTQNPRSMRYDWRRAVNRDPRLNGTDVRVLFELESYAEPDGTNAHPGSELIASMIPSPQKPNSTLSVDQVGRILKKAREIGYIERTAKARRIGPRRHSDVYRLTFPPADEKPQQPDTQMSVNEAALPDTQVSTNDAAALPDTQMSSNPSITRHEGPDYPTPGCRDTRSFNTNPSSYVSNAGADARETTTEQTLTDIAAEVGGAPLSRNETAEALARLHRGEEWTVIAEDVALARLFADSMRGSADPESYTDLDLSDND